MATASEDVAAGPCAPTPDPSEHMPMVFSLARRHWRPGGPIELEDLVGFGAVGLVKGMRAYRRDRGAVPGTFAYWCIRNAILAALRAEASRRRPMPDGCVGAARVSVGGPLGGLLAREALGDLAVDYRDAGPGTSAAAAAEVPRLLDLLSGHGREREVVCRRFGLEGHAPQTFEAIGRDLGVSKERARQIMERALRRIREAAGPPGPDGTARREPLGVGPCPGCGTPYGRYRRCYRADCRLGKPCRPRAARA
jgi:RNA polymerase sporulation-specific sigma factor